MPKRERKPFEWRGMASRDELNRLHARVYTTDNSGHKRVARVTVREDVRCRHVDPIVIGGPNFAAYCGDCGKLRVSGNWGRWHNAVRTEEDVT
jgi:hypothetical protein